MQWVWIGCYVLAAALLVLRQWVKHRAIDLAVVLLVLLPFIVWT